MGYQQGSERGERMIKKRTRSGEDVDRQQQERSTEVG